MTIGNAAYDGVTMRRLYSCVRDASAMHDVLREAGFHMLTAQAVVNATRKALRRVVRALAGAVSSGDTVVVFYSGHGVVADNSFHFVPVDAGGCAVCCVREGVMCLCPVRVCRVCGGRGCVR